MNATQTHDNAPPTAETGKERINKAVRFYRIVLRIALTIMFFVFVKKLLSQLPTPTLTSLGAYVMLKLSFVVYMYCWFLGCNRDLSVENDVLLDAPKPTVKEVAIAAIIIAGFAFLFYVENPVVLSTVFFFFLAANVGGWVYLQSLIRPLAEVALQQGRSNRDVVAQVKTLVYQDYMFGLWQWWRFATGFALLAVLAAVAFGGIRLPGLAQDVAFATVTAVTIGVLETWMWYHRLKLKIQWDGLDWLAKQGFVVASTSKVRPGTVVGIL